MRKISLVILKIVCYTKPQNFEFRGDVLAFLGSFENCPPPSGAGAEILFPVGIVLAGTDA